MIRIHVLFDLKVFITQYTNFVAYLQCYSCGIDNTKNNFYKGVGLNNIIWNPSTSKWKSPATNHYTPGIGNDIHVDGAMLKGKKKHRIGTQTKQEPEPNLDITHILELPDSDFKIAVLYIKEKMGK